MTKFRSVESLSTLILPARCAAVHTCVRTYATLSLSANPKKSRAAAGFFCLGDNFLTCESDSDQADTIQT